MKTRLASLVIDMAIATLITMLAACGSDNGGGTPPLAATERIVYLADQDLDGVRELYLVGPNGTSTKLNPPLPVGRSVTGYQITPDRSAVVYLADQTTDGVLELYRVPLATPGVSTKLNGSLDLPRDVIYVRVR